MLTEEFSSLSESGFIPTIVRFGIFQNSAFRFSSLSESGFIPTFKRCDGYKRQELEVLISFREWLHSYKVQLNLRNCFGTIVLISFREWLHSYNLRNCFGTIQPSGCSHLFQRVASFLHSESYCTSGSQGHQVLISFREWLHSYPKYFGIIVRFGIFRSHLFQRVASFLPVDTGKNKETGKALFSSLSESGFIPTEGTAEFREHFRNKFSSLSESGFIPTSGTTTVREHFSNKFSSLSESGFIPTKFTCFKVWIEIQKVLISFREWLHSY